MQCHHNFTLQSLVLTVHSVENDEIFYEWGVSSALNKKEQLCILMDTGYLTPYEVNDTTIHA